jgi:hypothetical protein
VDPSGLCAQGSGVQPKSAAGAVAYLIFDATGNLNTPGAQNTLKVFNAAYDVLDVTSIGIMAYGGIRTKPGSFGQFKGTDALRAENAVARDAAKAAGLNRDQQRILHDQISGQGKNYKQILEIAKQIKVGDW